MAAGLVLEEQPLLRPSPSRRPLVQLVTFIGFAAVVAVVACVVLQSSSNQPQALLEVGSENEQTEQNSNVADAKSGGKLMQQERPRKWWHWSQDPRFNRHGEHTHGLETQFSHWLDKWHNDNPDASLNEEAAAWYKRQVEIQKMFDWEAEQRRKLEDEAARQAQDSIAMPDVDKEAEARRYGSDIPFNPLDNTRSDGRDPFPDDPAPIRHPPSDDEQAVAPSPVAPSPRKPVRKPTEPDGVVEEGNLPPWHDPNWDHEEEGNLPGWDELIKDRKGRSKVVGRPDSAEDFVASQFGGMPEPAVPQFEKTPETIIAEPPGPPDFNGHDAIIASHPDIGIAPTDLEENNMETRGSFTVQLARTGYMGDGEVAMTIWGPPTEFKCTVRGYRKLSNDFQGNTVYTGFKKSFVGERKINTGYISPGVTNEYDLMDCRSEVTGETQYFRVSFGTDGYDDLRDHGPPNVLGDHFGANIDSVTFDMDRPTYEDEQATQDYYRDYDVYADNKPFK